jgi:hypothetical protein
MPNNPAESFRMSFWWLLGYVVLAQVALFVPVILAVFLARPLLPPLGVLLGSFVAGVAFLELYALAFVAALSAYFKVYVSPDGLRAFNFWGLYREVAWAELRSAGPVNFLGLKYLRAYPTGGRAPLWLPLFLRDQGRFCALVRQYAGPEHPVAVALQEEEPHAKPQR